MNYDLDKIIFMMMMRGVKNMLHTAISNDNSKCVLLVCNVPAKEHLQPVQWLIIENFDQEWRKKNDDKFGARLKIVYLEPQAKPDDARYAALKELKPGDQICVIGHHYAGEKGILSDPIYTVKEKNDLFKPNQGENAAYYYTHEQLSEIILHNVPAATLKIPRNCYQDDIPEMKQELNQLPLRIKLHACSTSLPEINFFTRKIISESIAKKMFNYLFEKGCENILVRGREYDIVPTPVKNDEQTVRNFYKLFIKYTWQSSDQNRAAIENFVRQPENKGFHIRNMFMIYRKGYLTNPITNLIPFSAAKGTHYKTDYTTALDEQTCKMIPVEIKGKNIDYFFPRFGSIKS